jgi:hypothetical protein
LVRAEAWSSSGTAAARGLGGTNTCDIKYVSVYLGGEELSEQDNF